MTQAIPGGFLVALEGIDGAGKSTVARHLAAFCDEHGLPCVSSREPTDGPWGRLLRYTKIEGRMGLEEELRLFLKDRAEHVEQVIEPALHAGRVVVLDRYYYSTAAYQGARGANPEEILDENEKFAPLPDLVLLLDLDPTLVTDRLSDRGEKPDSFEALDNLIEARRIFLSIHRPNLVRIDANLPTDEVARHCVLAFSAALERKRSGRPH